MNLLNNADWILSFNGPSRLILMSLIWLALELVTRYIAKYSVNKNIDKQSKTADKGSWWLILLSSGFLALIVLSVIYFNFQPDLPMQLIPVGIVLMGLGIALRIWAVMTLGKFFTMEVKIFSNHKLVENGPYRWLQHPSYTGVFLTALGFGLASGYFGVLIAYMLVLSFVLGYRIHVEDKALEKEFGPDWIAYSAKRWKLIPGIL